MRNALALPASLQSNYNRGHLTGASGTRQTAKPAPLDRICSGRAANTHPAHPLQRGLRTRPSGPVAPVGGQRHQAQAGRGEPACARLGWCRRGGGQEGEERAAKSAPATSGLPCAAGETGPNAGETGSWAHRRLESWDAHATPLKRHGAMASRLCACGMQSEETLGLWTLPPPETQPRTLLELSGALKSFLQVRRRSMCLAVE